MSACDCANKIKVTVDSVRQEAKGAEVQHLRSMNMLKESVLEGAVERISRMLYKAGVYQACMKKNFQKRLSVNDIISALEENLSKDNSLTNLYNFMVMQKQRIMEQERSVNVEELLRRLVSNKNKAEGLLTISSDREIKSAKSALERVDKLKRQLETWKANLRLQDKVQYFKIVDMHDQTV